MFANHSRLRTASAVFAGAMLLSLASIASAQTTVVIGDPNPRVAPVFELRPYAGTYIPTGVQDRLLTNSFHLGGQAALRMNPTFGLVGNFSWTPTKDELVFAEQKVDLFNYDVGFEARASAMEWGDNLSFQPFIGVGGGARTYNYRDMDEAESKTFWQGYGSLGGELGYRNFGIRLEARDYVSEFRPLTGAVPAGSTEMRNDVTLSAGISLKIY